MKKIIRIVVAVIIVLASLIPTAHAAEWIKTENSCTPYVERYTLCHENIFCSIGIDSYGDLVIHTSDSVPFGNLTKVASQHIEIKEGKVVINRTTIREQGGDCNFGQESDYGIFEARVLKFVKDLPSHIREKFGNTFDVN